MKVAALFTWGLVLCACKRSPAVTSPPAADAAAVSTSDNRDASAAASASATHAASASTMLARAPAELADAGDTDSVTATAVVGFAGGAVLVYAVRDGDKSNIIGRVLDAEGRRRGPARLVRRTSGTISGLAIAAREGVVWIAWGSSLESDEKHLAAAVRTDTSLGAVSAPVTLVHETLDSGQPNHWVHVLALPSGGAIVATRGAGQAIKCMFAAQHPSDHCRAPGYKVIKVSPDGGTSVLAHRTIDGNPLELAPLVDVGGSVAVRAWAWHGGAMHDDRIIAYEESAEPPSFVFSFCNPPYSQVWTGDELVTLCDRDYPDGANGERCAGAQEGEGCPRVLRSPASGANPERRGSLVRAIDDVCADGHPAVRITRGDGSRTIMDSMKTGGTSPRFAGWTGKVLLEAPHQGGEAEQLTLKRRRCRGTELVDAPIE